MMEHFDRTQPHGDMYSLRMPTPPRIVIPQPFSNDTALQNAQNMQPTFLQDIALTNYDPAVPRSLNWQYNDRRTAQQILPYLWLGPMTITRDPQWFQEQEITMMLGVRTRFAKLTDAALQRVRAMGLETQFVDVPDEKNLIKVFPIAAAIIKEHMIRLNANGQRGRVLVCCESGNEASATVVAAFAMEVHSDVDHIKAIQLCQSQRFSTQFDDNSKRILQAYWDILMAQRAVAQAQAQAHEQGLALPNAQVKTHKRQLEDNDDVNDTSHMGGERREYAPFF